MKRVICIGEALIDFVCLDRETPLAQGQTFVKKPGGAPANVAACISRLGGQAEFVGALGQDAFGEFLLNEMAHYGVGLSSVQRPEIPTTLAFVSLTQGGERDFEFNRGADAELQLEPHQTQALLSESILHFGSATALLPGPLRASYFALAQAGSKAGNLISFDPNYRSDLWQGQDALFIDYCQQMMAYADLVKVSDEELRLLTGQRNLELACQKLHKTGPQAILVTLGAEGCLLSTPRQQKRIPAYQVEVVDTTGAGDAFIGAILYQLSQQEGLKTEALVEAITFANKVSACVCQALGAMTALPTMDEVEQAEFVVRPSD